MVASFTGSPGKNGSALRLLVQPCLLLAADPWQLWSMLLRGFDRRGIRRLEESGSDLDGAGARDLGRVALDRDQLDAAGDLDGGHAEAGNVDDAPRPLDGQEHARAHGHASDDPRLHVRIVCGPDLQEPPPDLVEPADQRLVQPEQAL